MANYNNGSALMGRYFGLESAMSQVVDKLQQGRKRIDFGLVSRAREEVQAKSAVLDTPTYRFAQDLSFHLYGGEERRIVMLVEGVFHGDSETQSLIPIDLGNNPWRLFKHHEGHDTIDDAVTLESTRDFVERNSGYLTEQGYRSVDVGSSRFFYFGKSNLESFLDENGKLDMARLVPLIVPTEGRVVANEVDGGIVLDQVASPTLDDYMKTAPIHVSYRLKKSMVEKLCRRIVYDKGKGPVSDWVAHRPVVDSPEDVEVLAAFLRESKRVGKNSRFDYLETKHNYEDESANGHRVETIVGRIETKGFEPSVREIQIVDKEQYFANELSSGRTSHAAHKGRIGHISRKIREDYDRVKAVLEQIFGTQEEFYVNIEILRG